MSDPLIPQTTKAKGLLNETTSRQKFTLDAYDPPRSFKNIIDKIWHVRWNFPNQESYHQTNLPHPTQHIVVNPNQGSRFVGCSMEVFNYEISGTGQVIGLKLSPGMGRVFYDQKLSNLTNDYIPLDELIGKTAIQLDEMTQQGAHPEDVIEILCNELGKISYPVTDPMIEAQKAVETIEREQDLFRVDDFCELIESSPRNLQRLFSNYIGVPPKWVIKRYRMLNLVEALNTGARIDLAQLALDFGFTDQSHFTTEFKSITGQSPAAYLKRQART